MKGEETMNNRGQAFEIVGIGIILLSVVIGLGTIAFQEQTLYVGDKELNIFYKYSECHTHIDSLSKERIVVFRTKESAYESGMVISKCPT